MREQPELQHMSQDIAGNNPYQVVRSPWNEGMDHAHSTGERRLGPLQCRAYGTMQGPPNQNQRMKRWRWHDKGTRKVSTRE